MTVDTIINFISAVSIIVGIIFAVIHTRQYAKQRARESALQLLHSYQTPEFQYAVNLIVDLPEGLSKKEVEDLLGDKLTSLLVMFGTFEALGVLIYRNEIDINLVEDFFSGVITLAWKKFKAYILEMREISNRPSYYEWFQWMSEQIEKRELKTHAIPAHIALRDWKK
jgi:hypothetical protein